ncbi:MAG: protein kinase [Acidobacteriota bacterium]|nr:protein kinase [Acidobacteriota bacterium]
MANTRWQKIDEIFSSVADLPPGERDNRLRELCAGDEDLLREISAMLAVDEKAENFIETPVMMPDSLSRILTSGGSGGKAGKTATLELAGRQIGSYRVIKKLGAGGMGAVYLAERADGEFHKKAAIKLVKNGADTDFNLRRFRHERQILAELEHPNIARLIDGGTTEAGVPYFVMEYVEGKTLFDYCGERQADLTERLRLFRQICAAVSYAHARGIIHRDLKPSNILVTADGTPKLLDFGIAKILDPEDWVHDSIESTATLMRQMTPEYASPEQIKGEAVTAASDVYSLGVCLYELLTGERPYKFTSRAPHAIARVVCEQKIRIPQFGTASPLSEDLKFIILKSLQKQPAERYATVADFDRDIERFLEGVPVVAAADARAGFIDDTAGDSGNSSAVAAAGAGDAPVAVSLTVAPFQVLPIGNAAEASASSGDDFLGIGLADALTTKLSGIRQIAVRPTSSVLRLASLEAVALGKALDADFVLTGRILRGDGRIRVAVQLLKVSDNSVLWAHSFDESEVDIFSLLDSISERVAALLVPHLTLEDQKVLHYQGTANAAAYEAYLRGRVFFHNYTYGGMGAAENCFAQAIALDPNFALAHCGLADFYNWQTIFGLTSNREGFSRAKQSALKAIELDPNSAEAHAALAFTTWAYDWDFREAERLFEKAVRLNPNYPRAHEWYALQLSLTERHREAFLEMERAEQLDPNSPAVASMHSLILYNARRYEESLAKARRALELDPDYYIALQSLGWICPQLGKFDEAIGSCRRAILISDEQPLNKFSLALALIDAGQTKEARRILAELEVRRQKNHVPAYYLALLYANLGEDEKAFEWFDRGIEERGYYTLRMRVEPRLDRLRGDARFARRLEAIKPLGESKSTAAAGQKTLQQQQEQQRRKVQSATAEELSRRGRAAAYAYTFEGIAASEKLFQEAIALDPNYAPAYSGLADFYNWQTIAGLVPPASVFPAAKQTARRAIELDPNSSEAHASLAFAAWAFDWDFAEAERLYRKAIALDPNNAKAREWFSYLLSSAGRHDEAIAEMQRADRLDPDSPTVLTMFALCYHNARQYEKGYEKIRRALELDPNYYLALKSLAWVCPPLGKVDEGIAGARRAVEISDELKFNKFALALALCAAGQRDEARKIAVELEKIRRERYAPAYFPALIYANLGERETAFRWLDEAIAERGYWTLWLGVDPRFDSLREDSRFAERLARIESVSGVRQAISADTIDDAEQQEQQEQRTEKTRKSGKFKISAAALAGVLVAALILAAIYASVNFKILVKKLPPADNLQTEIVAPSQPPAGEKPRTSDSVADGLYLAGKRQMEIRTQDALNKAIEFFNEAVERDPNFALAYSGLADAHILTAGQHKNPLEAYRKAEDYALKALALDPDLAEARISLGMAKFINTKDFAAAEKHFLRAIEIDPSLASAHHWYSHVLLQVGKIDDAVREKEIAARLAPDSAVIQFSLGHLYMQTKRYDEAVFRFDKAIENNSSLIGPYYWKSYIQQIRGDYDAALDTYRRVRIYGGEDENDPSWLLMQAQAHAAKGRRDEALAVLNRCLKTDGYAKRSGELLHEVALVYNLLGDSEDAFAWLDKIEVKSAEQLKFHLDDSRFANLYDDARYTRLIEKWQSQLRQMQNR